MTRTTIDRAFLAGWQWSGSHGDQESTPGEADTILRTIGLPTNSQHIESFCNATVDRSRGDRWRLEYITRGTDTAMVWGIT